MRGSIGDRISSVGGSLHLPPPNCRSRAGEQQPAKLVSPPAWPWSQSATLASKSKPTDSHCAPGDWHGGQPPRTRTITGP